VALERTPLRGNSGSELVKGGDGDDRILADSGNDIVDGGDGGYDQLGRRHQGSSR